MLCFSVGFRCTKWSGHWVWKRTLGHASHVPLYDVHSAAVPPFLSPSSRLPVSSSFILAPPLPYSASVARSSSSAPLGTPPPLWSRLPRSTFCSRWERDRNSRCTAECLCCCWSCVPVCACMCERRAHVWMHSCGAEERRVQVKLRCYRMSADCRLDADVSHQHGRGSCLDCWRGEGAAAAPDCDCLWTLLPPPPPLSPLFHWIRYLGYLIIEPAQGRRSSGFAANSRRRRRSLLRTDDMLWEPVFKPLFLFLVLLPSSSSSDPTPRRVPVPPCPWRFVGTRITQWPTTWTEGFWTTAVSWMRSMWCLMSSSSSSHFLFSSWVSVAEKWEPQPLHTPALTQRPHTHAQVMCQHMDVLLLAFHLLKKLSDSISFP